MKNFKFSFTMLCILLTSFTFIFAQPTFTVNQDISFKTTLVCGSALPIFSPQNPIPPIRATIEVSHNITSPTSPNLPSNLNDQCYRFFNFQIYNVENGVETLEATVTKTAFWLQGALTFNGSSKVHYQLTEQDLVGKNLSTGLKKVYLVVSYYYFGSSPYTLNMFVTANDNSTCSVMDIGQSNTPLDCPAGMITCFQYEACGADLSIDANVEQVLTSTGGTNFFINQYTYSVSVIGGSGNYSYYWAVENLNNTSTSSSIVFQTLLDPGEVTVRVTDNVTGCIYFLSSKGKKALSPESSAYAMQFGPNPLASGAALTINYLLPARGTVDFHIYDMTGRHLRTLTTSDGNMGGNIFRIQETDLAPGTYLLQMRSEKSGTLTKRLVIQ